MSPTRKQQSRARIVEVAARAIRSAGFHGVGVASIMKGAGLPHGGFYAHFASRNALLSEALDGAGRDSETRTEKAVASRQPDAQPDNFALIASQFVEVLRLARALGGTAEGKALLTAARRDLLARYDNRSA